jgi:phosphoribosylformylglycinamidine synthase subunit PurS
MEMQVRMNLPLHHKLEVAVESYRVPVRIVPRSGVLDPQGTAVAGALRTLGFSEVVDIRVGRFVTVDVNAANPDAATATVRQMCEQLLANPVIEDFVIDTPAVQPKARP